MKKYNIAISASISYAPYAKVMLSSFLKYHKDCTVDLYVFYINKKVLKLQNGFQKILKKSSNNNSAKFIEVNYEKLKIVDSKDGWALDLWCRWYLLDFLKEKCERILMIGCDTMFQDNIDEFYFQNLDGYYFSCCPDMFINSTNSKSWERINNDMKKFGLDNKSKYINGDVILINLKETKNHLNFNNFLKLYSKNRYTCWDQDIITYNFNHKIKYQNHLLYNYFPNLKIENFDDDRLYKNAKIIHFAGGPKPWIIPILKAKDYNAIPEWWEHAIEVGVAKMFPYLHCYMLLTYRFLRDNFKSTVAIFKNS